MPYIQQKYLKGLVLFAAPSGVCPECWGMHRQEQQHEDTVYFMLNFYNNHGRLPEKDDFKP